MLINWKETSNLFLSPGQLHGTTHLSACKNVIFPEIEHLSDVCDSKYTHAVGMENVQRSQVH